MNTFINQVTELFCKTPRNIFCLQAAQCSYGSCSLQSLTRSHQLWRGYFTGNKETGRQWTIAQVGPFGGEPSLACNSLLPAALRRSLWRPPLLATGNWPGTSLDTLWLPSKIYCHFELSQIIFILWIEDCQDHHFQFIDQKEWIAKTFPRDRRFENLIAVGENVLTADAIRYVSGIIPVTRVSKVWQQWAELHYFFPQIIILKTALRYVC